MLDKTVLEKISGDPEIRLDSGYFFYSKFLEPKIRRSLDGIVIARSNELGYDYNELAEYLKSKDSEELCLSVARGIPNLDYSKLP